MITESMMCITPFEASTSVVMIFASLTKAPLSLALITTEAQGVGPIATSKTGHHVADAETRLNSLTNESNAVT